MLTDYFACDTALIASLTPCQVLASCGVGFDQIDVDAADAAGIVVTNNPSYCIDEVAEHTVALIMSSLRWIVAYDRHVRSGGRDYTSQPAAQRIRAMTIAVLGYGKIGRAVVALAKAMGFTVVVHDPFLTGEVAGDVTVATLHGALRAADVLTLRLPLSSETKGLIGADEVALLRSTAGLVNTARGGLIDGNALTDALTLPWRSCPRRWIPALSGRPPDRMRATQGLGAEPR